MAHREVLIEFFARYPSALGMTHAGGQYRLICPQCGNMVPVAVLSDEVRDIDVVCYSCGYEDHLTDGGGTHDVVMAPQRVVGMHPGLDGLGANSGEHQIERASA